ncbi:TPA: AMP-binding protein [Enterobacter cloacae]|nr:AMP-binding protein [Enterobacter cloacae]
MRIPELADYPVGVREYGERHEALTLPDIFEDVFVRHASRPAFECQGAMMTFERFDQLSRAFAAWLQNDLRLREGERVAIMLPNIMQFPVVLAGLLRAGLAGVCINPLYTPAELLYQLQDCGARVLVVTSAREHIAREILRDSHVEHLVVTGHDDMSFLTGEASFADTPEAMAGLSTESMRLNDILRRGAELHYHRPRLTGDSLALLQYTGGTTGVPKGAMLLHRNLVANLEQTLCYFSPLLREGMERVITALPLCHIYALTVNFMLFFKLGGCNVLIPDSRNTGELIAELQREPFTAITGVNTLFNTLLNHPGFESVNFGALRMAVGAGAAVQQGVAQRWENLTGRPLLEGYGLSECSPVVAVSPWDLQQHNGCVGLPLPGTYIRLVDSEGQDVHDGQQGELLIKGPQVMAGYWNQPEETQNVFRDGWLATGDMVRVDENGYLKIVDRKKDVILVSGFNVYPNEIEDVICLHPGVLECAVVGAPCPESGERVQAWIVRKYPSLTEQSVIIHCRQFLTRYKQPREIVFCDSLPRSVVGKILRRDLKK